MSSILLIDHHLDPALAPEVELAAQRADVALRRWAPGQDLDPADPPQALVAALGRGARRLPATVAHLADDVFPGSPVVLLSDEPLVQPYILLHGGRVTLMGPPHEPGRLAERVAAAVRWRRPAAVREDTVRRQDLRNGRGRACLVIAGAESAPARIELNGSLGLTAVLAPHGHGEVSIERDLLPTIDAWHDQPDSDQLRRALGGRGGWGAMVHLDPEAGRWLLAGPAGWPIALASPQRMPAWWSLPAGDEERVSVLAAEAGDVVLAAAVLPDGPEFTPQALAAAAAGGAAALADHLAEAARSGGHALAAVAVEVRS